MMMTYLVWNIHYTSDYLQITVRKSFITQANLSLANHDASLDSTVILH